MTVWAAQPSNFDGSEAVACCWSPDLGLFLVGGSGSESLATSPDGVNWTDRPSAIGGGADAVVWADGLGLFVASGADGGSDVQIVTSPDGIVWTPQVTPWDELATHTVLGLAWSPDLGLLIAVGESFTVGETVMTSPDGVNWTAQAAAFDSPSSGARGLGACWSPELGLFIVAGNSGVSDATVMTSPDGAAWTAQTTPFDGGQPWAACWSSRLGLAAVVGSDPNFDGTVVMTSSDGVNWVTQTTPWTATGGGQGFGVFECGTALVFVGDANDFGGSATEAILESVDGVVWTADTSPFDVSTGGEGRGVCYSPELSLAVAVGVDGGGAGSSAIATAPFVIPPPPPILPRVYADLPIRTFVTTKEARTLSILDHRATDRQFLWVLNGPAYHTAQVASDDLEINQPFPDADSPANLTNNRRLIYALQRWQGADPPYQPIFGGILMIPEDQGTDTPTTRYTAYDGWQYMMSRPVRNPYDGALPGPEGLTFPSGSLASDIALGLLEITELIDGETHIDWSDSGLIESSDPLPSDITFDPGLSVGEAWSLLCNTGTIDIHLDPMYEPIDAPGKINRFRVVAQSAGSAAGPVRYNVVMGWDKGGRSLAGVNRLVDGTRLANEVQFFAGEGGTPAPLQTDATSVTAYGEYWAQQFFPGSNDATTIALLAVAELAIRRNGARSISLDPAPERVEIPLRDYGLGDYLPVWASKNLREPLGIDYDSFDPNNPGASGYQRVYAIPMQVDDNGVAKVSGILTSKEN